MGLKRLSAPGEEPVTLSEATAHCRVDGGDEDFLFSNILIPAAREAAEHRTGRVLVTQRWELTLDAFPLAAIEVPRPPLQTVQRLRYIDPEGAEQILAEGAYSVHTSALIGLIAPAPATRWPATRDQLEAVTIEFTAGYGDASDVPAGLKAWMLLAIGTLYERRESLAQGQVVELPGGFWERLLDPYIVWGAA